MIFQQPHNRRGVRNPRDNRLFIPTTRSGGHEVNAYVVVRLKWGTHVVRDIGMAYRHDRAGD